MGLTKTQASIWQKAESLGSGGQAVGLSDESAAFLIATIVHDLNIAEHFPEFKTAPSPFFGNEKLESLKIVGVDARLLFGRLVENHADTDTYFACLAALHKARLKYDRILQTQPLPTLEQVGPRGLLQYGQLNGAGLAGFLFWRKWFFDIDNRAGQETGYLFEPIIAYALGGIPAPAKKSPVKRHHDSSKGRQVDCLLNTNAYEFKIRVTIAASGQGRWQEELDFPKDCKESGYTPILVCMDSTPNPKLDALVNAFKEYGGHVFIGQDAWNHLDDVAGPTMARFIDHYVKRPIEEMLSQATKYPPALSAEWSEESVTLRVGESLLHIDRYNVAPSEVEDDEMPDDVADEVAG